MFVRLMPLCAVLASCAQYLTPTAADADLDRDELAPCQEDAVLDWLNDPATTAQDLKDSGVHSRAADNLVATRNGDDGEAGTSDDVVFVDLDQVDAVSQVGPSAMDALTVWAVAACPADETCEPGAIVDLVNDPDTTADMLKAIGVHATGANNLVALRPFTSVSAIDDVSYVGPSSMDALWAWADSTCAVETIFSPQPYWDSHIARSVELIDGARRSVDVAMYSFSDYEVRDALARAHDRGVDVRVIYEGANAHSKDPSGTWSAGLEDLGIEVRWVNKVMHHKFFVVDGPHASLDELADALVYTSSGNWSYSAATKYDENTIVAHDDPKLVLQYQREFEHLWTHSRGLVWNEAIAPIPGMEITDADVASVEGSEAVFTSDNFRVYESASNGWTFARQGSLGMVQHRIADLIDTAKTSVKVASGHMRNRPIAEALMRAHDRGVDVQVVVDVQEFTSEWTYWDDIAAFDDCMVDAGSDVDDQDDCREMGVYWGYGLVEHGIETRYKSYSYRWDYTYAVQLHDKYVIVDDATVAMGSYNYSANAEFDTIENVAILSRDRYPVALDAYIADHARLWNLNRDNGTYDAILDDLANGTGTIGLTWTPVSLTWAEHDALKDAVRAACPAVDSDEYRQDAAGHTTCPR